MVNCSGNERRVSALQFSRYLFTANNNGGRSTQVEFETWRRSLYSLVKLSESHLVAVTIYSISVAPVGIGRSDMLFPLTTQALVPQRCRSEHSN